MSGSGPSATSEPARCARCASGLRRSGPSVMTGRRAPRAARLLRRAVRRCDRSLRGREVSVASADESGRDLGVVSRASPSHGDRHDLTEMHPLARYLDGQTSLSAIIAGRLLTARCKSLRSSPSSTTFTRFKLAQERRPTATRSRRARQMPRASEYAAYSMASVIRRLGNRRQSLAGLGQGKQLRGTHAPSPRLEREP